MAAKGFIELLRLSDRGRKTQLNQVDAENTWSGVAFEMLGQYFVAPLGDVNEVIYVPELTQIPNTKNWACGIANLRGRLLSVFHLPAFVKHVGADVDQNSKVMCLNHLEHYSGVIVDKVYGIQHFNTQSYFREAYDLDESIKKYCQGYFVHQNEIWHVFMLRELFNSQEFMSPSL
ncbi:MULTISPECIES: chemotaxis protein CheW [unclassified Acinetobacter]|uniref:chemotaxis protein CheW n=1 Tax=unclassified Acinetobacter TaxID=196816 RepID=UPI0035B7FBE4